MRLGQLVEWHGRLSRLQYFFWGAALWLSKYLIDRFWSAWVFERDFDLVIYFHPFDRTVLASMFEGASEFYGLSLLAISIPFAAAGLGLTIQRLRDAGLPRWLCVFFVVPYINFILFAVLLAVPRREVEAAKPARPRWVPASGAGSAAAAVLITVPATLAASFAAISVFNEYALGLFIGLPFVLGFTAAIIYNLGDNRGLMATQSVVVAALTVLGLGFLAVAIEGAVCILMASPIAVIFGALGGWVGYVIGSARHGGTAFALLAAPASLALLMGAEPLVLPETSLEREVLTIVEIDAPPAAVWPHVIELAELPPPDDWLFATGIAYPLRAEIRGTGVGAVRHCVFSTGPFVEPITEWAPPNRLGFDVTSQPDAMDEASPYPEVHAKHLNGYLTVRRGQFILTALPEGRTRLEGRTWYTQDLWPSLYWEPWSDWIIHRIHQRVLRHIEAQVP